MLKHMLLAVPGVGMAILLNKASKQRMKDCELRWKQSMNLPRKAKKLARKHILVDYHIAAMGVDLTDIFDVDDVFEAEQEFLRLEEESNFADGELPFML